MYSSSELCSNQAHQLSLLLQSAPRQWSLKTPLQRIRLPSLEARKIEIYIKREDLIDPRVSGNKLYKLHGHLARARRLEARGLASFGGYYSNHLHALAYAGAALRIKTKARIRGYQPNTLPLTLADCQRQGMLLEFGSRRSYKSLTQECLDMAAAATLDECGYYWIPEGGGAREGSQACRALLAGIQIQAAKQLLSDYTLCVPCGTGTTAAGLLSGLPEGSNLYAYSALKLGQKAPIYQAEIEALAGNRYRHLTLFDESNFGGFAKTTPALFEYMKGFTAATGILLDPIYTAKMFYQIERQAEEGLWSAGDKIIAIHTGGLQGRRGFRQLTNDTAHNSNE